MLEISKNLEFRSLQYQKFEHLPAFPDDDPYLEVTLEFLPVAPKITMEVGCKFFQTTINNND